MASQADLDALREGQVSVPSTDEKAHEFDDAERQWKVLNPETLQYPLDVDGVERIIEVKCDFSINDLFQRRILDDIGVFYKLFTLKLRALNPGSVGTGWLSANPGYLDIAMSGSDVKDALRAVLVKLARFVQPFEAAGLHYDRPSIEQLALGMSEDDEGAYGVYLTAVYQNEVERRKNARASASQSGLPTSSRSSRPPTPGRRRTSSAKSSRSRR